MDEGTEKKMRLCVKTVGFLQLVGWLVGCRRIILKTKKEEIAEHIWQKNATRLLVFKSNIQIKYFSNTHDHYDHLKLIYWLLLTSFGVLVVSCKACTPPSFISSSSKE